MFYERNDGATEIKFNSYTIAYRKCGDIDQLKRADMHLAKDIETLEALIIEMKALRIKIADQAMTLRDIPTGKKIELSKGKTYQGRVEYSVKLFKTFDNPDIYPVLEKMKTYTAQERKHALRDFNFLKELYPQAEIEEYI